MPTRLGTQCLILANQTYYKTDNRHRGEDEEQYLCNFNGPRCNPAKPKHGSNQRNKQKDNRIVKHVSVLLTGC